MMPGRKLAWEKLIGLDMPGLAAIPGLITVAQKMEEEKVVGRISLMKIT